MPEHRPRTTTADRVLHMERVFDAPRPLVFQMWVDPEHAAKWWAPEWCEVTTLEMDVRPGGKLRKCMTDSDGEEHWRWGEYKEVDKPKRLVFTYFAVEPPGEKDNEMIVEVDFDEEEDGRTKVTLRQALFNTVEGCESHTTGWTSSIERLGEYLAEIA